MKRKLAAGLTSATIPIFVRDTTSTTGAGLSGLTSSTSGLVAEYRRQGASAWTAITLSAGTLGTWSSGGFVADGALGGAYEVGIPDAALASGARWVAIRFRSAANMLPVLVEIELDVVNYQSASAFITGVNSLAPPTNWNLAVIDASGRVDVSKMTGTALTARDIGASVLLSAGTGTGQLDFTSGVVKANLVQILATALTETAGQIAGAFRTFFNVASPVHTTASVNQTGDAFAGTTLLLSALAPYFSTVNDAAATTISFVTALTGTADLSGARIVFTAGSLKGVYRTIATHNTTTGAMTFLSAFSSAPANGATFAVVQGSKALELFLAALGTDNKVILSNNAQTGVTIPTVTAVASVTGNVGGVSGVTFPATVGNSNYAGGAADTNAAAIKAKTDLIATNAADSPNTATEQAAVAGLRTDYTTAKAAFLDIAISSRGTSTYAGGAVSGVTGDVTGKVLGTGASAFVGNGAQVAGGGNVTVGAYATGQDPATLLLITPANKLSTDATGKVALLAVPPTAVQVRQEVDSNSTQLAALVTNVAAVPAATLTVIKADVDWKKIVANVDGVFDYNETTRVLTLKDKTGTTTLATLTMTLGTAAITHRASA